MIQSRSALNYLVVGSMLFMTAIAALFVYFSLNFKGKITLRTVQQTEFASDLLARSATDVMKDGHSRGRYFDLLEFGEVIGVEELGIFRLDGREAMTLEPQAPLTSGRSVQPGEMASFLKSVESMNPAGFFDDVKDTYTRYIPLKAEGGCLKCHMTEGEVLGVLRLRLSTASDFELLGYMQTLIWVMGVIVLMPVAGLLVAGAVIKEKNRIFSQLKASKEEMEKTYDELKNTKYYIQMILDNSRVIIVTTDTNGRIVEFNREAEALLEYSKDEVVGKDVLMLYDNPRQRTEMMSSAGASDGDVWEVRNREVRFRSKSGRVLHVMLTLSTMVNEIGRIIGTVGVGKDITEQKMLQFKLMQSEKLAGIGTLATGIAHEINNPLAGILGMAEAIRDEGDIVLVKSYTNDIIKYSETARKIVRELSHYSRSANSIGEEKVDIAEVMENSLKMAKHSAAFHEIQLEADLTRGLFISANAVEAQQVFVNLIVNAVHAMGEKGTLTLRCWREDGFVKAMVKDTGVGIPEKNLSQVFDPFFTTKPVGMGTGLGLYVVYKIITKYGGSVEVESVLGQGTAFVLKFPCTDDELIG
ncbi:MAG: PAS domain S-box protein [Deltaproteobacteria bacterium]|nr:PAS domain S-box protein [Deltaproteobacteria bacterium]